MQALIENASVVKRRAAGKLDTSKDRAASAMMVVKDKTYQIAEDETVQTAASAAAGAAILGATGLGGGLLAGGALGAALGVAPALFTFGLSIPIGSAIGAACGMAVGGTAGAAGGSAIGYGAYTRRAEIKSTFEKTHTKAKEMFRKLRAKGNEISTSVKERVQAHVGAARAKAKTAYARLCGRTAELAEATKVQAKTAMADGSAQVTVASAAGGAVVFGAGGAATGLVSGGVVGAALGVVPAFFTFGLSIPVGAALGSSTGLAVGTVVGGTTGLIGGGATGYGVYTRRDTIRSSLKDTITKVDGAAKYVKDTATTSADYVRTRIVGGTGGTSD